MRKRGAGAVAVIVLVVIIVACVGFVVFYFGRGGPPAGPDQIQAEPPETEYLCVAEGCGWRGVLPDEVADAAEKGSPVKGNKPLMKCPKCGKFSVGRIWEGDSGKYVDLGSEKLPVSAK